MKKNKNIAVLGTHFGDEAKSRIVHWMAPKFDYVVRFGGSLNAGHTIYHNGKKIVRHMIPSADFTSKNKAFLGSGMVLNLEELLKEVKETEEMFPGAASKIIVDPDAFVILPEHIKEDEEKNGHIGSTGKGVSPAYKDKIGRTGVRVHTYLESKSEITKALEDLGVKFKYSLELMDKFEKSKIIFEGSQSILLDIAFGTYPFVTSGECGIAGIVNSGFVNLLPRKVYGISKCYGTRVGNGPFPTEILGKEAEKLRERGQEYGATTGRARRVGWLDLPSLKYACRKGGITNLIITKLDILSGMKTIPVCLAYDKDIMSSNDLFYSVPKYADINGWQDHTKIKEILPLLSTIENITNCSVDYISCGINDKDIIKV